MIETTYIYTLNDPRTGAIRYVGKADKPQARFESHLRDAGVRKTHKNYWILELRKLGMRPRLQILHGVPKTEWQQWEQEYIRVFRVCGMKLTNGTVGGEGGITTQNSTVTFEKIRQSLTGKKYSLEHRAAISRAKIGHPNLKLRGRERSAEHRHNLSIAHKGKHAGEKNPFFGRKHSPEMRQRCCEAGKAYQEIKKQNQLSLTFRAGGGIL